jgi:hypothetical protein
MASKPAPPPEDIVSSISCMDCVNALFHCYGVGHQFDRYYKTGTFSNCERQREELSLCVKLKFADPEDKARLLRQLVLSDKSPTDGTVWQLKKDRPA